ncbi:MAG: hypothetical protein E6G59_03220, partial [Actinobacteria bacterium]
MASTTAPVRPSRRPRIRRHGSRSTGCFGSNTDGSSSAPTRAGAAASASAAPGPRDLLVPPAPHVLAELPYWVYHPLGIERKRADTVKRVCARAARMEEAASMPTADAYRRLQAI